ncbi:MAG: hypothetical protein WBA51_14690 [Erythrobacter sp.]
MKARRYNEIVIDAARLGEGHDKSNILDGIRLSTAGAVMSGFDPRYRKRNCGVSLLAATSGNSESDPIAGVSFVEMEMADLA